MIGFFCVDIHINACKFVYFNTDSLNNCLSWEEFQALCTLIYCDVSVPIIDTIYYLVKRVDYALLSSQPLQNNEELYGSMCAALCNGVSKELSVVFGKSEEEEYINDDESR